MSQECRACENCEHFCSDCGKSFCIDHINRHPCKYAGNAIVALRFANAEIGAMRAELARVEGRVQAALELLETLQEHTRSKPAASPRSAPPTESGRH